MIRVVLIVPTGRRTTEQRIADMHAVPAVGSEITLEVGTYRVDHHEHRMSVFVPGSGFLFETGPTYVHLVRA